MEPQEGGKRRSSIVYEGDWISRAGGRGKRFGEEWEGGSRVEETREEGWMRWE
jgi:hypothetical protein